MENKQTAVKWVFNKLTMLNVIDETKYEIFRQLELEAKAMEKEQIKDAYKAGCVDEMWELKDTENEEHYYNKTYVTNAK